MTARRRWLKPAIASTAIAILAAAGIAPVLASPSDPAEPGFYLYGEDWALSGARISVARVGTDNCEQSDLIYFRDSSTSTLLETQGRGFPGWGDIRDVLLPNGVTGDGDIVVTCGTEESNDEVTSIPISILSSAPASLYRAPSMFTDFTRSSATVYVLNKVGYTPGESVRVTLFDQSRADADFGTATATPVTVTADGAGAITATIPVPGTFSGNDYSSLISSATSRTIYDTWGDGDPLPALSFTATANPVVGGPVTVSGSGYAPGETVVVALHAPTGDAVVLGTLVATSGRAINGTFTIPSGTAPGSYRIWAGSKTGSYLLQNAAVTVTTAPTLVSTANPTITGSATVGSVLTATKGAWAAAPAPVPTYTYSWWRDGTVIPLATAATYTLKPEDFGATITVRVQAAKSGYASTTVESSPTATVGTGILTPAAVPTITGTAKVGSTLTAATGVWSASTAFTYQWFANAVAITDATNPTVVLTTAEFGKKITVTVTGTKPGLAASKTSVATAAVAAIPFASTVAPVISGAPQVGVQLSADPGTWSPAATFTYQWYAGGIPVSGATTSIFTPKGAQLGKAITVSATGSATGSLATAKTSLATTVVVLGAYAATPDPTVTGTAAVGASLSASTTGWDAGSTFSYRWFADSVPITGAIAATYVPTATQVGEVITVRVTSTTTGYPTVARTSSVGSSPVARGAFATAPTPTITKSPAAGALRFGNTLTAVTGAWSPAATYSYQWFADGVEIVGAEATTYKPTAAQIGATFTVRVIGAKSGYTSTARTSSATGALEALTFTTTPVGATITGTGKVGVKLTAVAGTFTPTPAYTYQWFADGVAIDGATASTYTPLVGQVSQTIAVQVSGGLPGYAPASKLSAGKVVAP